MYSSKTAVETLTVRSRFPLKRVTLNWLRNSSPFMEAEGSFSYSLVPVLSQMIQLHERMFYFFNIS
jgi:hypothetical protein